MAVIWQPRFDSAESVFEDWTVPGKNAPAPQMYDASVTPAVKIPNPWPAPWLNVPNPKFITWPGGIPAVRFESQSPKIWFDGPSIMNWRKYVNENARVVPHEVGIIKYGHAIGSVAETDLTVQYGVRIDPDIEVGFNELGAKLPGFEGFGFSARMWHGIPGNGRASLKVYWYGATNPAGQGFGETLDTGEYLYFGKIHFIKQRIKQNTKNPDGTYNADGIVQVWLDGRLVLNYQNFLINNTGPAEIEFFFSNFYHGGMSTPKFPFHYEFGGVQIARDATELVAPTEQPEQPGEIIMPTQQEVINASAAALDTTFAFFGQPSLVQQLNDQAAQITALTAERDAANSALATANAKIAASRAKLDELSAQDAAQDAAEAAKIAEARAALD